MVWQPGAEAGVSEPNHNDDNRRRRSPSQAVRGKLFSIAISRAGQWPSGSSSSVGSNHYGTQSKPTRRLWHSIFTAKGFEGAFHRWWPRRPVQHQGAPRQLQGLRLTVEVVETLYADFQAKFESWHIRQRHKVIQKRYESNQHQIYQALTRPRALEVDHLLEMRDYTILAHEQETGLTHLDKDIEGGFHSQSWDVEEEATKVVQAQGDLITLETSTSPTPGQTLTSTRTITDEQELQDSFAGEWRARWNAHLNLPEDVWNRAIAFGIHFLPKGKLEYAEVEMSE